MDQKNREFANAIVKECLFWGVEEFYVCAGARDIPLIEAVCSIESEKKVVFNHFEERSAAFYALGRIKSLQKPVAIITTSGTAVAELFPAVMEAYYSGLPLVLITADRPKSYRSTGAPQSAEQKNIFGIYVSHCFDLELNDTLELKNIPKNKPLHINVCFDVPLQSGKLEKITKINLPNSLLNTLKKNEDILNDLNVFKKFISKNNRTLVIVAQIFTNEKNEIVKLLKMLNYPVYIESISNIRELDELNHLRLKCGNKIWSYCKELGIEFDSVIKIGGTPTHRLWRDLDESKKQIKVLSIGELPFPGMPNTQQITTNLNQFCFQYNKNEEKFENNSVWVQKFISLDNTEYEKMLALFYKYPQAEQSLFFHLSEHIAPKSKVYLGTSLPIRYWDLAATFDNKEFNTNASRGVNGIDGVISTFLGFANEKSPQNWGLFGDLTTLYDLASPWVLQHRPNLKVNIVVINNGGGGIFKKVLKGDMSTICQNIHNLNFEPFAKLWGLDYEKVFSAEEIKKIAPKSRVIEIIPNNEHTEIFASNIS